jgi:hypothetical protein
MPNDNLIVLRHTWRDTLREWLQHKLHCCRAFCPYCYDEFVRAEDKKQNAVYRTLSSVFFIAGPYRCGRLGIAIQRRPALFPCIYRSSASWTSFDVLWVRVYWWKQEGQLSA